MTKMGRVFASGSGLDTIELKKRGSIPLDYFQASFSVLGLSARLRILLN